jgi:tRNA-splicing ligase RtcB (3'-phosphate/5'-hydroxy nucleic acid ligase)
MHTASLERIAPFAWRIPATGAMRVPAVIFASEKLVADMDEKVREQAANVACLPGIVEAAYVMPDAHWGYGFPIGGVAAFDPEAGGVISAGGVGFDVSCGVRTMLTRLPIGNIESIKDVLASDLARGIPAGLGRGGRIHLDDDEMDAMLSGGAAWAVARGWGRQEDLERIEDQGRAGNAEPASVPPRAKQRQRDEMGTLGSGNHYLEVQEVAEILDAGAARAFGLERGAAVVTIHCGSRGLGHQIGTEFLREMVLKAATYGIDLPDRELACAPIRSELGQRYLGAMRAAINCALANRQIISHLVREVFARRLPEASLDLLFDVSHNTCKVEEHEVDGAPKALFVHRKGATRAFGPGHHGLPPSLAAVGQPVLIGGSMGTESWVLAGMETSENRAFSSACHGAGRAMSRHQATKQWSGRQLVRALGERGIIVRSPSMRGIAEEAPGAYKEVGAVVRATEQAGLARRVARLLPRIVVKG